MKMKRFLSVCALSLLITFSAPIATADAKRANQVKGGNTSTDPWWKHAVIYEIYPRSFADSDNSGMGDIKGITQKLDYLKDLGIDAIWLTPCFPSPQVDFGYDISDYCDIAPEYGTLKDFDELVQECRKRKIRIIMDLVMNHTSDQHAWFKESRSSLDNPRRNWFVWRNARSAGKASTAIGDSTKDPLDPPNNWQALFGHSAWTWNPPTRQYYYHFFYPQQPDLNWRDPEVEKAMFDVARFWLDRGASGFRLDAINTLYEDPELKDNPIKPGKNAYGDPNMEDKYNYLLLPEIHKVLKRLRKAIDVYPDTPVLLGETTAEKIDQLVSMYGNNNDEIQLPMDFRFAYINKLSAKEFRAKIIEIDNNAAGGWPTYLFSNHDQVRHYNRYGDGKHNDEIAKVTATILMTVRGTPVMYYGEELGMENNDPSRIEDVQDPIGKIGWPTEKGRDGERTPMQWSVEANAGFSSAKPWLPVAVNYKRHNVEVELQDPNSILNYYKQLLSLRKSDSALKDGDYSAINATDENVLSYLRRSGDRAVIVACNMTGKTQDVRIERQSIHLTSDNARVLLSSHYKMGESFKLSRFRLPPFATLVAEAK